MPRISIVSFGGDPESLKVTATSLGQLTSTDWQWIVVSSQARDFQFAGELVDRIKMFYAPEVLYGSRNVLTQLFDGTDVESILIVEPGDVLRVDAIERYDFVSESTAADLVYGDVAFIDTIDVSRFNAGNGWVVRSEKISGYSVNVCEMFDPTPGVLLNSTYVPRSGLLLKRAWFDEVVGTLQNLDRFSPFYLVARTLASGRRIAHNHETLVISTVAPKPPVDFLDDLRITNSHLIQSIENWADFFGYAKLDLGAAHNPQPGYLSVDLVNADITCDVRDGLPFEDSTVGVIRASDFLEHINHCPDSSCVHDGSDGRKRCVVGVMNEFYRVLAPGGWLLARTPSSDGRGAFQDPTHVSFWNPNSFWYYTRRDQQRFVPGITCRFQAARLWQDFPSAWHRQNNIPYVNADLVALKGQRQPGPCEI